MGNDYPAGQTALVSTPGADARQITDTTWDESDRGVPIYWLNGARVADDYADFYDGVWADEANPTNDIGEPHSLADPVPWTGTDHDGTELFDGNASRAVGQSTVGVGAPGSTANNAGPLNGAAAFTSTEDRPLYSLWHVLVVDENLRLVDNNNVVSRDDEGSDTRAAARAQLFTTGSHPSGYGIDHIQDFEWVPKTMSSWAPSPSIPRTRMASRTWRTDSTPRSAWSAATALSGT